MGGGGSSKEADRKSFYECYYAATQGHSRHLKPQHGCGLYPRFAMKSRMFSSPAMVK